MSLNSCRCLASRLLTFCKSDQITVKPSELMSLIYVMLFYFKILMDKIVTFLYFATGNVIVVASWTTVVNIISLIIIIMMSKCKSVHLLSSSRLDNGQRVYFCLVPWATHQNSQQNWQ